jgi:hypothetical protein
MKSRIYGMLLASLGAAVFLLAADETFAGSRAMGHGGGAAFNRAGAHRFRHHQKFDDGFFWSGDFGSYGPSGAPGFDGTLPPPGDFRSSNASDIPWDWAHRYPPLVTPSARPYVSSCDPETVKVPDGHGGTGEVNIIRCY